MTIVGTGADWSRWTRMTFARPAQSAIDGALTPISISLEHDQGVYIKPNVWVHHSP
jgi:hypothetical protein